MVDLGSAEDLHHARQKPIDAGTHVHGLDGQPDRIDPDHRSSSRIQAAHVDAAWLGQLTLITVAPRRNSIRISAVAFWAAGICAATKPFATALGPPRSGGPTSPRRSASSTQRRARLALIPLAMATAAIDTPGARHAA